ncbi:hypothetical protein KIPB_003954 [Kipferlia bialata]|uniref:Uncharacterized protein n=1 Tax=Kipferlia bialata TaxID=797122 RepID=A0A9K3CUP4_9EUKA|nr:hypothetical protein KIPB_003954 [Kipferlia bialata]|eukprot:g3954.t1
MEGGSTHSKACFEVVRFPDDLVYGGFLHADTELVPVGPRQILALTPLAEGLDAMFQEFDGVPLSTRARLVSLLCDGTLHEVGATPGGDVEWSVPVRAGAKLACIDGCVYICECSRVARLALDSLEVGVLWSDPACSSEEDTTLTSLCLFCLDGCLYSIQWDSAAPKGSQCSLYCYNPSDIGTVGSVGSVCTEGTLIHSVKGKGESIEDPGVLTTRKGWDEHREVESAVGPDGWVRVAQVPAHVGCSTLYPTGTFVVGGTAYVFTARRMCTFSPSAGWGPSEKTPLVTPLLVLGRHIVCKDKSGGVGYGVKVEVSYVHLLAYDTVSGGWDDWGVRDVQCASTNIVHSGWSVPLHEARGLKGVTCERVHLHTLWNNAPHYSKAEVKGVYALSIGYGCVYPRKFMS